MAYEILEKHSHKKARMYNVDPETIYYALIIEISGDCDILEQKLDELDEVKRKAEEAYDRVKDEKIRRAIREMIECIEEMKKMEEEADKLAEQEEAVLEEMYDVV